MNVVNQIVITDGLPLWNKWLQF